ncbi:hypothetical protein ABID60_006775 [Bradyrhizobium sp. S3.5.5]
MPTPKQMQKMAALVDRKAHPALGLAPNDDLPAEYWDSLLRDAYADETSNWRQSNPSGKLRLSQITQHMLRLSCRRCARILEIQRLDAVRLYGPEAVWRDVGLKLLNSTCQQRTGRHEEDGCWPDFDLS